MFQTKARATAIAAYGRSAAHRPSAWARRGLMLATVGTIAALASPAPALATGGFPTRTDATTVTMNAPNAISITFRSGTILTCATFSVPQTVDGAGGVTVASGAVGGTQCFLGTNAASISQPRAWSGTIMHLHDAAGDIPAFTLGLTVPTDGLVASFTACTVRFGGGLLGENDHGLAPVVHGVQSLIGGMVFTAALAPTVITMTVTSVSNTFICGAAGITVNTTVRFFGVFNYTSNIRAQGDVGR